MDTHQDAAEAAEQPTGMEIGAGQRRPNSRHGTPPPLPADGMGWPGHNDFGQQIFPLFFFFFTTVQSPNPYYVSVSFLIPKL